MSERSREKIALVVFALLVVFAGCCLVGYIFAGHSWNVAATNIDDTFGSLDGYTVIAYAGTVDKEAADADGSAANKGEGYVGAGKFAPSKPEDEPSLSKDGNLEDGTGLGGEAGSENKAGSEDGAGLGDGTGSEGETGSEDGADSGNTSDMGGKDTAEREDRSAENEGSARDGGVSGADFAEALVEKVGTLKKSGKRTWVSAAQVQQSYEDKGATVFVLDTKNPGKYSEGVILKKDGHRFGVFSLDKPITHLNLRRLVAYFESHKVDFIVAVVADSELLKEKDGIDIVISTQDEGLFSMGETRKGTFFVNAPEIGKVGAVLISPSNVVSAKTIDSL